MKKSISKSAWLFLFITFTVQPLLAQAPSASALAEEADKFFQAKDWPKAMKVYERLTKQEPANFLAWNRLGSMLHGLARYDEATKAYEQALAINSSSPIPKYNLACAYTRMNEKDKAFALLNQIASTGVFRAEQLSSDEDLASLREDPRFADVLVTARKNSQPCTASPEFRQLDFWIGEWDVQSSGQPVGKSSVQLILGDCVIFENWTGGLGMNGKSFNLYDATRTKWQQTWVSDRGGITEFVGEFKENKMEYFTEVTGADGSKSLRRMTLFNLGPDRVRQLSEATADGGKTWTTQYDFIYLRKK